MVITFSDPSTLSGARISGACPITFTYGSRYTFDVECITEVTHEPVDLQARLCTRWTVQIAPSLETPTTVLATETTFGNPFTVNRALFSIACISFEMYKYAAGSKAVPAVLFIYGYKDESSTADVAIQLPILLKGSSSPAMPKEPSTALMAEAQLLASIAGAAAERSAELEIETRALALRAQQASEKIPDPDESDAGKIPVVNPYGTGYDLKAPGQVDGITDIELNGHDVPIQGHKAVMSAITGVTVNGEPVEPVDGVVDIEAGGGSGAITGEGAPTSSTEGELGQRYVDMVSNISYTCTGIDDTDPSNVVYEWTAGATLDANGKVSSDELPRAAHNGVNDTTTLGVVGNAYNHAQQRIYSGISIQDSRLTLIKATDTEINDRTNNTAIGPTNLNYAVRSVLPNVTIIPDDTTEYALLDASATTNNHSMNYRHAPTSAPTYTLPAVADDAQLHEIVLNVRFSAVVQTYAFQDASGNPITPLDEPILENGTVVSFLCRYEPLLGIWCIMPFVLGTYTAQEG